MFQERYTPTMRGFTEHAGYYQGCGSAYTHIAGCCQAGSTYSDVDFVCNVTSKNGIWRGYDWWESALDPPPELPRVPSKPVLGANHTNSVDLIRDHAISFIKRKAAAKTPFFLYLPFQNVHGPFTTQEKFFNLYLNRSRFTAGEATLFGYITELDDAVGSVVATLKSAEVWENTIVVFSSDNGAPCGVLPDVCHPQPHAGGGEHYIVRNYPFRGAKTTQWEGGTRVPGFIGGGWTAFPTAARGTINTKLFHVTDWLPTLAKLGGVSTEGSFALDGHDIFPALTSKTVPSPRTEVLYNVNPLCFSGQARAPKAALRVGDYKLMAWCFNVKGINGSVVTGPVKANATQAMATDPGFGENDGLVLYDVERDPGENTNIRALPEHAARVRTMLTRMTELALEMVEPQQWDPPYQGSKYFCAACPKHPNDVDGKNGPAIPWSAWIPERDAVAVAAVLEQQRP